MKYFLLFLLASFVDFGAFAQSIDRFNTPQAYLCENGDCEKVDLQEALRRERRARLQEHISQTICNQEWFSEVTGEDVWAEMYASRIPRLNDLFLATDLQRDIKGFVGNNFPCDSETGNTPLFLALNERVSLDVPMMLIDSGGRLNVTNNEGTLALDIANSDERYVELIEYEAEVRQKEGREHESRRKAFRRYGQRR